MSYFFQATASQADKPIIKGHLKMGDVNPKGNTIIPNSRYIEKDGRPWLPVMGEFHYSRYPAEAWEDEILKMKAGGIDIIASYVFWIHHEEKEGHFDWSGNRNLRKFVELCGRHGLYFFARIGPWCHGECRNGGFPDWLLTKGCKLRSDDPQYLSYVRILYKQIAKQLEGLYFKDGGPIIGIQFENELQQNAQHLSMLKEIAHEVGMSAPLYTVTGWGGAHGVDFPELEVIPAFGGYPEAPWEQHVSELKPSAGYFFHTIRNDNGIGDDLFGFKSAQAADRPDIDQYPYLTCEIGGGIQYTYHRRPKICPDDVAALSMNKLASGANMLGYYMFHGGSNPIGQLSTMQESRKTGYPNDYPVIAYDFQAPIGQFGQIRGQYHILRCFHLFLRDFGHRLAPMTTLLPDILPEDRYDTTTARMAIRVARNGEGFIFFNNHQRYPGINDIDDVQARVCLDNESLLLPRLPFTLKKDAYFFWPFNFQIGDIRLKQATVQPLCFINSENEVVYFFKTCDGIAPEYIFEGDVNIADAAGARVLKENGNTVAMNIRPGIENPLRLHTGKNDIILVTLTQQQAEQSWKGNIGGRDIFVLCEGNNLFFNDDGIVVYGSSSDVSLMVYPALDAGLYIREQQLENEKIAIFERYRLRLPEKSVQPFIEEYHYSISQDFDQFLYLSDDNINCIRQWRLTLPEDALADVHDIILRVHFIGDVIQVYMDRNLVNDEFYYGVPVEIGLSNFNNQWKNGVFLKISPLRRDMNIYLQKWPEFTKGKIAELINVEAIPVYRVKLQIK